jgi:hypothetical protein
VRTIQRLQKKLLEAEKGRARRDLELQVVRSDVGKNISSLHQKTVL